MFDRVTRRYFVCFETLSSSGMKAVVGQACQMLRSSRLEVCETSNNDWIKAGTLQADLASSSLSARLHRFSRSQGMAAKHSCVYCLKYEAICIHGCMCDIMISYVALVTWGIISQILHNTISLPLDRKCSFTEENDIWVVAIAGFTLPWPIFFFILKLDWR